ncbi:amino acid ABC transporter substrate-binding protein [Pseudomonas sp. NA-150]|uniref:amino acid ABC transporter substrate-binding protein n=1 Tax=Pseudomonas sp. NA-150 TaxID=3367525 RepID=UPI0037CA524F
MNVQLIKPASLLLTCLLMLVPALASANTLERVRTSNTVNLGFIPDFAPFSSNEGDKVSGYAIDLCLKVADKIKAELGLPSLKVHYQPVNITEQTSAVSSGKVDILCTPTPATLERSKTVSFSVPVYTAGLSVVVRDDAPEALLNVLNGKVAHDGPTWRATVNRGIANETFAVTAGGVTEAWIHEQIRLLGVIATVVTVKDNDQGIKQVAEGKADAFFSERMLLDNHIVKDYPQGNLRLLDRIFEYAPVSMMINRDDDNFRLLVDTTLSEMYRSGAIEQAYDKYLRGASDSDKKLFKIYALP